MYRYMLIVGWTIAAIAPASTQAQDGLFTPHHVAKLRLVTSAVISPDGTQVAYLLSVPRNLPKEKDGPSWSELHVVDAKGNSTPFITGPVNIDSIAWMPDGKSITFLTKREKDEHRSLYVIPVRGGEARKVVSHGGDIQSYSFSPNGKRVAYTAIEPITKGRKAQLDQGFTQEIYEEDTPFVRVWIAYLDGGSGPQMLQLKGSASDVQWNPKFDSLAVALAPSPNIDDQIMFRKLHIVELDGKATNLNNPGKMGQFAWSPDGKNLALITGVDKHDPKEGRLWRYSTEKQSWIKVLGDQAKLHVESIAWQDPDWLNYIASSGAITILGSEGVKAGQDASIMFGTPKNLILSSLSIANSGAASAMIAHSANHPPEVFLLGANDKDSPRRLTDSNPWLRTMRFAKQEVVKYKARDGLEIEGILVRPLNEEKGKRYPLVLTVHGGPEAHISNGWSTLYHSLGQVGAARGFAVFYPNYRGSTGYGVEFSMKGQREAAGKEFDDLVDGVDHLIQAGLVDGKKVGITGGSYGGYATAWGSTFYSDRFAAGVMFVGISDSISKCGTTDIPEEMYLVHHRKRLWDDWDYFLKSSPIYHTDKAKTPLLILHGKNDPRVHPSQSLEMHRNLKIRGKAPVRLVLYPGEGHGNRRAASRLDYNLRLLQWMEHYLKGPGGNPPPYEIDHGLTAPVKGALGSWRQTPQIVAAERPAGEEVPASYHWSGRGCPCCIGW